MEVIFNSCWVLEIQNDVSANQRGSSTNHIGRFGGLDVISRIIGDRFIDPKERTNVPVPMTLLLKFQSTATKRTGRTENPAARLSLRASTLPLLKTRKYAAVLQTAVPDQ